MRSVSIAVAAALLAVTASGTAPAQAPSGGGKIFCWKNKSGKTECGDSIPYEHQDAAIRELNQRGITVNRTEGALTPEQRRIRQAELDRKQAEDQKREDARRRDKALLDTFSNEKEIDLKRSRDIQAIESNIETLRSNLKNMDDRDADSRARIERYQKDKRPVPQPILDDVQRVKSDRAQTERQIAMKRKEIVSVNELYDALKKRYAELTSGAVSSTK